MERNFNIIFWLVVSVLLLFTFGRLTDNFVYSFYFLTFFIPVIILTSWVFDHFLISRFLLRKHYGKFFLYTFYVFLVSLDVELILVFLAFLLISFYDYENLNVIVDSYKWMPLAMYLIVLLYACVQLVFKLLQQQSDEKKSDSKDQITVRSERKNRSIHLSEIVYIESMADYIQIFLQSGDKVITREKITRLHEKLPERFLRIHRSYIVNKDAIASYNKEVIVIGEKELPISRTYKKEVIELLYSSTQSQC